MKTCPAIPKCHGDFTSPRTSWCSAKPSTGTTSIIQRRSTDLWDSLPGFLFLRDLEVIVTVKKICIMSKNRDSVGRLRVMDYPPVFAFIAKRLNQSHLTFLLFCWSFLQRCASFLIIMLCLYYGIINFKLFQNPDPSSLDRDPKNISKYHLVNFIKLPKTTSTKLKFYRQLLTGDTSVPPVGRFINYVRWDAA